MFLFDSHTRQETREVAPFRCNTGAAFRFFRDLDDLCDYLPRLFFLEQPDIRSQSEEEQAQYAVMTAAQADFFCLGEHPTEMIASVRTVTTSKQASGEQQEKAHLAMEEETRTQQIADDHQLANKLSDGEVLTGELQPMAVDAWPSEEATEQKIRNLDKEVWDALSLSVSLCLCVCARVHARACACIYMCVCMHARVCVLICPHCCPVHPFLHTFRLWPLTPLQPRPLLLRRSPCSATSLPNAIISRPIAIDCSAVFDPVHLSIARRPSKSKSSQQR